MGEEIGRAFQARANALVHNWSEFKDVFPENLYNTQKMIMPLIQSCFMEYLPLLVI